MRRPAGEVMAPQGSWSGERKRLTGELSTRAPSPQAIKRDRAVVVLKPRDMAVLELWWARKVQG